MTSIGILESQSVIQQDPGTGITGKTLEYWPLNPDNTGGAGVATLDSPNKDMYEFGSVGTASGLNGNAASFDGNDALNIEKTALPPMGDTLWSYTFWFYVPSLAPQMTYIQSGTSTNVATIDIVIFNRASNASFNFGVYQTDGVLVQVAAPSPPAGQWNFVYVANDEPNNKIVMDINRDPTLYREQTYVLPIRTTPDTFCVGRNLSNIASLVGRMNHLFRYDNILTSAELDFQHGGGTPPVWPFT